MTQKHFKRAIRTTTCLCTVVAAPSSSYVGQVSVHLGAQTNNKRARVSLTLQLICEFSFEVFTAVFDIHFMEHYWMFFIQNGFTD